MEHFIINSSVCLLVLWLVYKLLLENTSWHRFKRTYLIGSLIIAAIIPLLVVRTVVIPFTAASSIDFTQFETVENATVTTGFEWSWSAFLLTLYIIGVVLMAFRLVRNLYGLRIKPTDEIESYKGYQLVLRKLIQIPHSFYNKIYASSTDYKAGKIPQAVLDHEKAHLDQHHSWDILLLELLIVVMWFNPLLYLIKYSIKLNHEFLADQAVISSGADTRAYQETLLAYTAGSQHRALANTFNFPLIKKRFTIMKTNTTTASGLLRSLAIIPVLALLVISCGQDEVVVEPEVIEIVEETPEKKRKPIYIDTQRKEGTITIDDQKYTFKRTEDKIKFYDSDGNQQDLEAQGHQIEIIDIEEVEIVEEEPEIIEVVEKPEVLKIITADDISNYNRLAEKHAAIIEEKGHSIYLKDETSEMQTIWKNMSREQRANAEPWPYLGLDGNKADEIAPPPPPQPWFTDTPTLLNGMQNGSIKLFIDGKLATTAQAKNLPDNWNINDFRVKKENGVTVIEYSGQLN